MGIPLRSQMLLERIRMMMEIRVERKVSYFDVLHNFHIFSDNKADMRGNS